MSARAQPLDGDPAARVLVAGASGFAGALAAQLVWRHPRLELARSTARSDAGTPPRPALPALPRPARADRARPRRGSRTSTRRSSPIRTAPRRRWSPSCAASACPSSTSRPTSGSATCRPTSTGTASTAPRSCSTSAVYGLTELTASEIARRELVANPGLLPDRERARARAARRGGADRRRRRSTPSQGVSGAGRGGGDEMHSSSLDENAFAYKIEGHRHAPEIAQELAALGGPAPVTFVPHLLPLDQGELASCYVQPTEPVARDELRALYAERYADEPLRRAGRRAARAFATCATPTSAASTSRVDGARPGRSPSPRSTTSGRAPPGRRSRTST